MIDVNRPPRKWAAFATALAVGLIAVVFAVNYFTLSRPLSATVKDDPRNAGIRVQAHYAYYLNPEVLIIDITGISDDSRPLDVFRLLLQYAEALQHTRFESVHLAARGQVKFVLTGEYFQVLGEEFGTQNPLYTARTFPEHIYSLDGERVFGVWTGGLLAVATRQMEDFVEFHERWYIDDLVE